MERREEEQGEGVERGEEDRVEVEEVRVWRE